MFSKTFPKTIEGSNFPKWVEVTLTKEEEIEVENKAKIENIQTMEECIDHAKQIAIKKGLNDPKNIVKITIALFEKRASHVVYKKENKCKEKFQTSGGVTSSS